MHIFFWFFFAITVPLGAWIRPQFNNNQITLCFIVSCNPDPHYISLLKAPTTLTHAFIQCHQSFGFKNQGICQIKGAIKPVMYIIPWHTVCKGLLIAEFQMSCQDKVALQWKWDSGHLSCSGRNDRGMVFCIKSLRISTDKGKGRCAVSFSRTKPVS